MGRTKKKEEIEEKESKEENKNQGKILLDASCTPADIAFPTDLGLLNKGRLQTEKIIEVRGKAGSAVEFGGKISVSIYENYVFLDKLSWDNFNESKHLIEPVEKYHQLMG